MNWPVWNKVESILREHEIHPIVAVVPDNRDNHLCVAPEQPEFWSRVRDWHRSGWTIAVHGYQHLYSTAEAGIVGVNARSEFAGVAGSIQATRIDAALAIFSEHDLRPTAWVAPGHSFDWETVKCLRERGIQIISDGFFPRPVRLAGCIWIPQQLWKLRRMPAGTWTVCCHINSWSSEQVERFGGQIRQYRQLIVDVDHVLRGKVDNIALSDRLFAAGYRRLVLAKRAIGPDE